MGNEILKSQINYYKLNHQHYNMIPPEKFEELLEAFEKNSFKVNEDKAFRKQLIENLIKYAYDHKYKREIKSKDTYSAALKL